MKRIILFLSIWFLISGIALIFFGLTRKESNNLATLENTQTIEANSIFGLIKERGSQKKISGAIVKAINWHNGKITESQSDSDGFYRLSVPKGDYVLTAQAKGYELSLIERVRVNSEAQQDIELVKKGQANPPPGQDNPQGYIFGKGAQNEDEVRILLSAHGILNGAEIVSIQPVNLTGDGLSIYYRDGQATAVYTGSFEKEPAWEVLLSDGRTIYVQRKCANIVEIPPAKVVKIEPTPASTPSPAILPKIFTATATALATAKATAQCPDGTYAEAIGYGKAEATATSEISYQDAYNKASKEAQEKAKVIAEADAQAKVECPPSQPTPIPTTGQTSTSTLTPTPTPTPTPSPTLTATPTSTPSPTPIPSPTPVPTLGVAFWPEPNSGYAPLNDVDLVVEVSGTAKGLITYKLDCTSDGSWEKEIVTDSEFYRAVDLCDYPEAGEYSAKVMVEREGLMVEGNSTIIVVDP